MHEPVHGLPTMKYLAMLKPVVMLSMNGLTKYTCVAKCVI